MAENRDIVFRRVRGRIIPIRKKIGQIDKPELAKGIGTTAAGFGVVGGGVFASRMAARHARGAEIKSKRLLRKYTRMDLSKESEKILAKTRRWGTKSRLLRKSSIGIKASASVIGGEIIEEGIERGLKAIGVEQDLSKSITVGVTGQIVSAATVIGLGKLGVRLKSRRALKKFAKYVKRLKQQRLGAQSAAKILRKSNRVYTTPRR